MVKSFRSSIKKTDTDLPQELKGVESMKEAIEYAKQAFVIGMRRQVFFQCGLVLCRSAQGADGRRWGGYLQNWDKTGKIHSGFITSKNRG